MASSKDITSYNAEELEILMLALEEPLTMEFGSKQETTYMRSRVYAVRSAAIHCWEKKQKLEKAGLDTAHLDIPIINAAQEIISITVLRNSDTSITVGRRLLRESIASVLRATIHSRGRKTAEEQSTGEMDAMLNRLKRNKLKEEESESESESGDVYKAFRAKEESKESEEQTREEQTWTYEELTHLQEEGKPFTPEQLRCFNNLKNSNT